MSPADEGAVELEVRVKAPPETVFSFFTDPEKYRLWKGHAATLDPRPGGEYRVDLIGETGPRGEYLAVEPPRRIVFTWGWEGPPGVLPAGIGEVGPGSTTVEVTLERDGDETIVRLRHTGLPTDASRTSHRWGWTLYLDRLRAAAGGADPGPEPLPDLVAGHRSGQPWLP